MVWVLAVFAVIAAVIFFDEWVQSRSSKKLRDWLDKNRDEGP